MAKAIGFRNRGEKRSIGTPFDIKSDVCRLCGGCMYVCPVCTTRCHVSSETAGAVCGNCMPLQPSCSEKYEDYMCYLGPTGNQRDEITVIRRRSQEVTY